MQMVKWQREDQKGPGLNPSKGDGMIKHIIYSLTPLVRLWGPKKFKSSQCHTVVALVTSDYC